jgi:hypothetical protein
VVKPQHKASLLVCHHHEEYYIIQRKVVTPTITKTGLKNSDVVSEIPFDLLMALNWR